jgi:hypothetical protein
VLPCLAEVAQSLMDRCNGVLDIGNRQRVPGTITRYVDWACFESGVQCSCTLAMCCKSQRNKGTLFERSVQSGPNTHSS